MKSTTPGRILSRLVIASPSRAPLKLTMADSANPQIRSSEGDRLSIDPLLGLAEQASRGDLDATRRLLDRVSPRVAAVARSVLGPWHPDVDDAVQQSTIAFLQALPAFRGECPPAAYAARIAVRVSVGLRRRARLQRLRQDDLASKETEEVAASAGEITAAERRKEILRQLLDSIPEEQAEALAMRVVLGWSLEEVAATSGVPMNTVRSRVRLAKEALRKRIEADPRLTEELEIG